MTTIQKNRPSDAVLDRLMSLHPKVIDLTLGRVHHLLERLDNPQERLPPVIHVAGTNGKGSVIAYMRAALESAGYRVHVYTSPHLIRFNERIRLAGDIIDEEVLTNLLEECEVANDGSPITFFEITTCAAFLAFSRVPADAVILETGLGGRLDATNVVNHPALTVITEISMDHQQFLGNTLEQIAFEKAGIIKRGTPVIVGRQPASVQTVIQTHATGLGAPGMFASDDWTVKPVAGGMTINSDGMDTYLPQPALPGEHQHHNAALAVKALENLGGFHIPGPAMARGLTMVEWPARFQHLTVGLLADRLPQGWELWLDGGHNEAAATVIVNEVRRWDEERKRRPLHLVFGMLNTKDAGAFLGILKEVADSVHTVSIPGEDNALSANDLSAAAHEAGHNSTASPGVSAAIEDIIAGSGPPPRTTPSRILICGSLYLAGEVLAHNSQTLPFQAAAP